jgi:hypothetical protein
MSKSFAVKRIIRHPLTGKQAREVNVSIGGKLVTYRWNTVFHVYNSVENYYQLQKSQAKDIVWIPVN